MRARIWPLFVFGACAALVLAGLARQQRVAGELRGKVAQRRAEAGELAQLQAENRRLATLQATEQELAELRSRQQAAESLRAQLATIHRREEELARTSPAPPAAEPAAAIISLKGNSLAARFWQNAGQATPDAAFQTTLWAAATGDLDTLTDLLEFDAAGRNEAAAIFDRLPVATQNELGSPERLVALLTAAAVPLGRAAILGQYPTPAGTKVVAQLVDPEGKAKMAVFSLRAEGDRWRLVVPAEAVGKYAGWLQGSLVPPGTGGK